MGFNIRLWLYGVHLQSRSATKRAEVRPDFFKIINYKVIKKWLEMQFQIIQKNIWIDNEIAMRKNQHFNDEPRAPSWPRCFDTEVRSTSTIRSVRIVSRGTVANNPSSWDEQVCILNRECNMDIIIYYYYRVFNTPNSSSSYHRCWWMERDEWRSFPRTCQDPDCRTERCRRSCNVPTPVRSGIASSTGSAANRTREI